MNSTSINEGQFVRHNSRPQWGLGFVERAVAKNLHVVFEKGGFKKIGCEKASDFLSPVQAAQIPQDSPVATAEGRKAIQAPPVIVKPASRKTRAQASAPKPASKKTRVLAELAVFTRNHPQFIEQTLDIHAQDPEREVTFRAATSWVMPFKAVQSGMNPTVYLAEVDGDAEVRFEARLGRVLVDPASDRELASKLNELSLESTREEGLWDGQVQTLYTITHLRRLERPFPMTDLIKMNGRKPIDANYTRAYCLVCRQEPNASHT